MKKRCAIYSRVSTSMQNEAEYSSCDAQKDRIMSYIKSQEDLEFTKEYSDPAFSGKDLERPALQQLFKDIIQKKINVVLTYKIDRFTRSMKDLLGITTTTTNPVNSVVADVFRLTPLHRSR